MRGGPPTIFVCVALVGACDHSGSTVKLESRPTESITAASQEPTVRLNASPNGPATSVAVSGISPAELHAFEQLDDARRTAVVRVFVAGAQEADLPSVLGTTTVLGEALRFTPRFPFAPGMRFRVVLDRGALSAAADATAHEVSLEFTTAAAPTAPATAIAQIYPTADSLPENQLKFYIHFSASMGRGDAYRHVHLLDGEGRDMEAVFLELGEELWDPALRRFTLLCDPARVKRGLVPREELGPVLQAGQDYTLVVDGAWQDAHGRPLAAAVRKTFHVLPADETPIDPAAWKLEVPRAGTRDPLIVRFGEPLDHALLSRMLRIASAPDSRVAGKFEITDGETCWRLNPEHPWAAGDYQLVVDTALEDLAGNAIGRAFDVDTFGPLQKRIESDTVAIPFTITAGNVE